MAKKRFVNEYLRAFRKLGPQDPFDRLRALGSFDNWAMNWSPESDKVMDGFLKSLVDRSAYLRKYSFAVPNLKAIDAIARYSPIVEMGAGAGYWASLLRQRGADVIAYDRDPGDKTWGLGEPWTDIAIGTPSVLEKHADRALFLCWPPSGRMAYDALQLWRGRVLIYVGEFEPNVSGSKAFFTALGDFDIVKHVEIPQWYGIHDRMVIFRR